MKPIDTLLVFLVVTIWGFNFVVIKLGLQGLPPLLFTALRFIFAFFPAIFFIKRPAVAWKWIAGYGFFQFALQFSLLFFGIQLGFPPGLASLVIQLQAFFTIGLAVCVLAEKPQLLQVIGALIAFSGMGLIALKLEQNSTVIGFTLVIAAGFCWAVANVLTKKMGSVNTLALVVWGSLVAAIPLTIASYFLEGPIVWKQTLTNITWLSVGAVLFQSYPNTILGFGIWSMLMRKYDTAAIAPFSLLVPVSGMIAAAIVLSESLQWWKITAGLLVLSGLMLNQFGARFFGSRLQ